MTSPSILQELTHIPEKLGNHLFKHYENSKIKKYYLFYKDNFPKYIYYKCSICGITIASNYYEGDYEYYLMGTEDLSNNSEDLFTSSKHIKDSIFACDE